VPDPVRLLRSSFSPYELAVGGLLGFHAFVIASVVAFATGRGPRAAVLLFLLGFVAFWSGYGLASCPNCRKSALEPYREGWRRFFHKPRIWPEQICSDCRTPLDVV
jgi:hypothetical protein